LQNSLPPQNRPFRPVRCSLTCFAFRRSTGPSSCFRSHPSFSPTLSGMASPKGHGSASDPGKIHQKSSIFHWQAVLQLAQMNRYLLKFCLYL